MTLRTRPAARLSRAALPLIAPSLVVLCLALGPRASAHPLFRIHVRPSAYRIAPPRLPHLRLFSTAQQVAGLASQVVALAPAASAARTVITQAPVRALLGRH